MSLELASAPAQTCLKTIALVDFSLGGHHAGWLRYFAETLLGLGHRVVCLCPDPGWIEGEIREQNPEGSRHFSSVQLIEPDFARLPTRRLRDLVEIFTRWRRVARLLRDLPERPDLVCFGMIDNLFTGGFTPGMLDLLFPFRWTGVLFHPRAERLQANRLQKWSCFRNDYSLQSKNCAGIAILDEGIADQFRRGIAPTPVLVFPDFIVPAAVAGEKAEWIRELRAEAGSRTLVGCLGALNHRKGIFTLLRIARELASADFFFVFAGVFYRDDLSPEELALWDEIQADPPKNCAFHLERISDEEFDALAESCDVLYAAYRNFPHSSNLLAKAAQFLKPVVVSAGYLMEERVRKFSLGAVVPQDEPAASLAALETLRAQLSAPGYRPSPGFAQYAAEHSADRLRQQLDRLINL